MEAKLQSHLSTAIHDATHRPFTLRTTTPIGGGSINEAYRLEGAHGSRYILKLNDPRHLPIFDAETEGLNAIAATDTIRAPRPIAYGTAGGQSYLVLEHLELSPRGDAQLLGEQLAALHRCTPPSCPLASYPPCRGRDREGVEVRELNVSTLHPALSRQWRGSIYK